MKRKTFISVMLACVLLLSSLYVPALFNVRASVPTDKNDEPASYIGEALLNEPIKAEKNKEAPAGFEAVKNEHNGNVPMADAKSGSCGDKLKWSLSNGTLTISGTGKMTDYDGNEEPPWYDQRDLITSLVVQSGATHIGMYAFLDCYNLKSIQLPSSLTSMGEGAFYRCSSLTSAAVPSGVKEIPVALFADCLALTSASAPGAVSIANYAFQNTSLKKFTVGKNLTQIEYLAFFNASVGEYAVESGNTVFTAKSGVLYTDSGKTLFAYPNGNTATSFTIPSGVKKVGDGAFLGNGYLSQITIPSGVTELGSSSFQNVAITSVTIPNSVTAVDYFTFYGCPNLKSVTFGTGLKCTSYQMFRECYSLETINFGSGLQALDAHTFAYCSSLKSVTLPANIKEIGSGAIAECRNLESFTSKGLEYIPFQAFLNDKSLTKVNLNEGLTDIYRSSFLGCYALESITLPASVKYVASRAFETCTKITAKNTKLGPYGINGMRTLEYIDVSASRNYTKAYEVLDIVNKRRKEAGLSSLVMNASLLETAMQRAAETSILFAHTRPDGSSCFDLNSLMYGENIACGSTTSDSVMNLWMNSAGHRANILTADYSTIGIGCVQIDGSYYWVQCFGYGSDTSSCSRPSNKTVTQTVQIATEEFDEAPTTDGIIWGTPETYKYTVRMQLNATSLKVGEKASASYYLNNPGNNYDIKIDPAKLKWSSSDTAVATVKNGTVTAVKPGTAKITATMANGFYKVAATVTVIGATPKLSSVENVATGVKVTWGKVSGADKYRVYYKTGSGSWTKIADTTSTSYTWTGAKSGTKYTFTVRCISSDGKAFTSDYDKTGKTITYIAAPKLSSVENVATGVKITWAKSTGAAKYRVYYKSADGWTKIADTTSTSYTWTGAKSGTKYTFTVRCLSSDSKSFTSSFDSTGKSIKYIAAPKLSSVENVATGVKITWAKSTGAEKYRVYYKVSGGSWTKIADTTSTSYTWTGAKSGTKYTFTVRCITSDGKSHTSSYDSTGKSVTYLSAPKITSLTKSSSGITINWGKVTGAVNYKVYRKTDGGSWQALGTTTGTSFVDKTGKKGTKYTYTVRCISKDGKTFTSGYDPTGKSITY